MLANQVLIVTNKKFDDEWDHREWMWHKLASLDEQVVFDWVTGGTPAQSSQSAAALSHGPGGPASNPP